MLYRVRQRLEQVSIPPRPVEHRRRLDLRLPLQPTREVPAIGAAPVFQHRPAQSIAIRQQHPMGRLGRDVPLAKILAQAAERFVQCPLGLHRGISKLARPATAFRRLHQGVPFQQFDRRNPGLAAKLGINVGNAKLADVVAKITSKSAVEKFREIYQPRMNQIWEAIKGNRGVINELKDNANFAGKMAMFAMLTNMVVTDLTLAGDPNAPLWQQAYQDFQIAVDNHESRGWSKPNELENAKASLMAALNGFRSGGDVLGIMRYILEVELENEIQNLR